MTLGKPSDGDWIGVWGKSPTAPRGEAIAERTQAPVLRVEDAFLRSLHPGRDGEPPIGLMLDKTGVHFEGGKASDLETLLATHPLDDSPLLERAREGMMRLQKSHLTKYAAVDPEIEPPEAGYVLVIDQTRGDASITHGGANEASFKEMLYYAQTEHPNARVIIKTHPETNNGHRGGHFSENDCTQRISLCDKPVSPWKLLEGAIAVYVVSSQMGFEALIAGHKPVVFGQPFYAGWGLTDDRSPLQFPRRRRNLTRAQLFAGAMLLYPVWYDSCRDRLCSFEEALNQLEAQARAWKDDKDGWTADNIRLWKRRHFQQFFGREQAVVFKHDGTGKPMRWGRPDTLKSGETIAEDGFLRSRGLGADLVPPMSLVLDDIGIYFDPTRPSRLERMISETVSLRKGQRLRAQRLIRSLVANKVSKYNLSGKPAELPEGHRILVPGQVEDDASVRYGCEAVSTNLALLTAAREANPGAVIIYKPHPDVEAGLREGLVSHEDLDRLADVVVREADITDLLEQVEELWTMTSLTGFEALLRGVKVTCLGAPFYAGWGLTTDLGRVPARRAARPDLEGLVHAALIDYPRYRDPVSGLPCPVEFIVERLASGETGRNARGLRILSKLQGVFASYAAIWR